MVITTKKVMSVHNQEIPAALTRTHVACLLHRDHGMTQGICTHHTHPTLPTHLSERRSLVQRDIGEGVAGLRGKQARGPRSSYKPSADLRSILRNITPQWARTLGSGMVACCCCGA